MYATSSSSGRDLQAMNEEVRHLTDRRAELEEQELVIMLELDPIDAELAALRARMAPLEARARELRSVVENDRLEIDAAIASATGTRAAEAAQLPAALSDRYETLRARLKGTGAARSDQEPLRRVPPRALLGRGGAASARYRRGEVATCEQCGRILVPS